MGGASASWQQRGVVIVERGGARASEVPRTRPLGAAEGSTKKNERRSRTKARVGRKDGGGYGRKNHGGQQEKYPGEREQSGAWGYRSTQVGESSRCNTEKHL
ncbi:hypothetical protein NDU88_007242 [Pleurodeles waltl]|uniref:Uncharacterized protein n=1 Tax=Pleurodeles waltl TaxID=8319 RepID=A0AAV7MFL6_PLEWA|nr:hypothetical protein NDU88_007242 [Pleurodeles waltl]